MLQNFGTALSREQMKHVLGGDEEEEIPGGGGGDGTPCTKDSDCAHITRTCESGTVVTAVCNEIRGNCQTTCVS
jgi:hypothetical protein